MLSFIKFKNFSKTIDKSPRVCYNRDNVPEDGIYTFALMSDDGSWLKIDGNMVVDNDREQSPHEMICQQALRKGMHKMEVRYFDHNGGMLRMHVYAPDGTQLAPADIYFCK